MTTTPAGQLRRSIEDCEIGDFVHETGVPDHNRKSTVLKAILKSENVPDFSMDSATKAVDAVAKVAVFELRRHNESGRFYVRVF